MPARRKRQKAAPPPSSSSSSLQSPAGLESTSHRGVKRARTCFTSAQLTRLNDEFAASRYLTNGRRAAIAQQLVVSELQVKIWFQNQRAKLKKSARAAPADQNT